jgi:Zn-dependent metalloprotease
VRFLYAEQGAVTREYAGKGDSEAIARAFLADYGTLFGLADQANQLQVRNVQTDNLGQRHVRFSQVQDGLKVFGGDMVIHLDAEGGVLGANGYVLPNVESISTKGAALDEKSAGEIAMKVVGTDDAFVAESELMVLNAGLITDQASETHLTYRVKADSAAQPHLAKWVFVDAHTGDIRFEYAAAYEGRNRNTYNMKHGTSYTSATLARSESQAPVSSATSCTATDVNNAHDYAGDTYDFYFSRFGRDSYNNAGAALNSYVCYSSNYQNAFWDGSKMTYGDGFAAADDVVSHELSHAVTEYASGLIYSYQSGALNESYSDIFGEAVDMINAKGTDTSTVRWDMGEDIPGIGAIRDMMDPGRFGDPDKTTSTNYYCSSGDNGGVHINSGVPNKAFALMVDGGSFNGYNVTPIGLDQAVQIQYRTNEVYLTSSAKMLDNYNGLIRSCGDLYGASSATCTNMKVALEAVKMNGPICGSGGATATPGTSNPTNTPAPQPTNTPGPLPTSTPTAVPGTAPITNGNFESGRNVGWAETDSLGYQVVTSGSAYQGSWKAWLVGANNDISTISQNIFVPTTGNTLYYRYRIASTDSCGWDYGYVRVGTTVLKTHNLCSTTNSSTYIQGSVSLAAYAGQTVNLNFRATTDSSVISSFYIDNVGFAPSLQGIDEGASDATDTFSGKPQPKPEVYTEVEGR